MEIPSNTEQVWQVIKQVWYHIEVHVKARQGRVQTEHWVDHSNIRAVRYNRPDDEDDDEVEEVVDEDDDEILEVEIAEIEHERHIQFLIQF